MKKILLAGVFGLVAIAFSFLLNVRTPSLSNPNSAEHVVDIHSKNSGKSDLPIAATSLHPAPEKLKSIQEESAFLKETDSDLARGKRLTPDEFQALAKIVLHLIPTKEALKPLTEAEVHHTPAPVLEAGKLLGVLAQAISNEPGLVRESISIYEQCVQDGSLMESVRALCFFNYRKYSLESGTIIREEVGNERIKELAKRLE